MGEPGGLRTCSAARTEDAGRPSRSARLNPACAAARCCGPAPARMPAASASSLGGRKSQLHAKLFRASRCWRS